jgi:multidrug resistance efflux pump
MNTSEGTLYHRWKRADGPGRYKLVWIAGYFKEIQLPYIQVGQKAIITMMGCENQPLQGVVRSVGWGIYVQDGSGSDATALLPSVNQTIDWVRLAQRFPVRIQVLGRSPVAIADWSNRFGGDYA